MFTTKPTVKSKKSGPLTLLRTEITGEVDDLWRVV
jgi:hypothetical protein